MLKDAFVIKEQAINEINLAPNLQVLQSVKTRYIGKKGLVTNKIKSISELPEKERPQVGKCYNEIKIEIQKVFKEREAILKADIYHDQSKKGLDITIPGYFIPTGRQHPINLVIDEVVEIFVSMGFAFKEGPEIEFDYYNFEALNIPKNHPARDMQDTFYISDNVVLRTHTSSVQIRVMETHKPPLKVIAVGKVYRHDADVSHTPMFHQVEGFLVDRDISMAHLKGLLEVFIHTVFGLHTPVRFRPSYFPFTEPSAEVDIGCVICKGNGCNVCKGTGWIEILGCGMINPKVFENVGYDSEIFSGLAFGMGIERIAMLKYGIDDIRLFFENDIRFLKQF